MSVACSCGVEGCRELGWPHEWDPIAAGDACLAAPPPVFHINNSTWPTVAHTVTAPYVRLGSGYACAACAEEFA